LGREADQGGQSPLDFGVVQGGVDAVLRFRWRDPVVALDLADKARLGEKRDRSAAKPFSDYILVADDRDIPGLLFCWWRRSLR
jgi:hypothetical protein